jgi:hypothetical protein
MSYTTIGARESNETEKSFTRLFTCPETGDDFQARFSVTEDPDVPIQSVEVKGVAAEQNDEDQSAR